MYSRMVIKTFHDERFINQGFDVLNINNFILMSAGEDLKSNLSFLGETIQ